MPDETPRLITRRRSLQLLGGRLLIAGAGSFGGAALAGVDDGNDFVARAAAACTLTPEQEEGPYYVPVDAVRADIIGGQSGLPFRLDESGQGTSGQTWLRGVQFTDSHGLATFHAIYPGHYQGRTTHVHVKVHTGGASAKSGKLTGRHVAHTGNLFSTDAVNAAVYALSPYTADSAQIVPRARDLVYASQHGSQARMKMSRIGGSLRSGIVGAITLGVDPSARPAKSTRRLRAWTASSRGRSRRRSRSATGPSPRRPS